MKKREKRRGRTEIEADLRLVFTVIGEKRYRAAVLESEILQLCQKSLELNVEASKVKAA